jgi:hypothetical protein
MTTPWRAAAAATLALAVAGAGCSQAPPVSPACIDTATQTVHLQVRNPGPGILRVPESRPNIGCCGRSGLSIEVTDAAGRDLDRCGFADNFDIPTLVDLEPGEAIAYRFSAKSLSSLYCKVDLGRQSLSVHDGTRPLGTHPLVPCRGK